MEARIKQFFARKAFDLYRALKEAGKEVTFYIVRNADHGGAAFWTNEALAVYDQFIQDCLSR